MRRHFARIDHFQDSRPILESVVVRRRRDQPVESQVRLLIAFAMTAIAMLLQEATYGHFGGHGVPITKAGEAREKQRNAPPRLEMMHLLGEVGRYRGWEGCAALNRRTRQLRRL